jgi:acetoin utilization deacetylase AcuC-like enzyme
VVENGGTKIDVNVGWNTTDKDYLDKVKQHFIPRVTRFQPDMIFHLLGHDTARGDYGDRGLSREFFPQLVQLVKETACKVCKGRYVVGLGGGSRPDIAEYIALKVVPILAGIEA